MFQEWVAHRQERLRLAINYILNFPMNFTKQMRLIQNICKTIFIVYMYWTVIVNTEIIDNTFNRFLVRADENDIYSLGSPYFRVRYIRVIFCVFF